jgi:hypothetical protein
MNSAPLALKQMHNRAAADWRPPLLVCVTLL